MNENMIKIAICDDEVETTSAIEDLIYKLEISNHFEIDVFFSGEDLLNAIGNLSQRYDLIYLDIEMGKLNGVDTAHEIRKMDKNVMIIFITTHVQFALPAYEVNTFRFLSKPINKEKFEKYYKLATNEIIKKPYYFRYTFNRENFSIPISQIMYFESQGRKVYIHTNHSSQEKCYVKLNEIENYLTSNSIYFYRISQSFLVNPDFVYSNMYNKMVLKNNKQLPVSESRREKVSDLFCKIKGSEIYG